MKLRTRLTLLFLFLALTILLVFAVVIYYSARKNREKDFYALLKKEAITKANLLFEAKVPAQTLQDIYHNNRQILNEVEVSVFDKDYRLLYHDAVEIDIVKETPTMLSEIGRKGEIAFFQDHWQVVGIRYRFEGQSYIITAAAYDQYGVSKLDNLLQDMVAVFVVSVILIYVVGLYFARQALDPLRRMTERSQQISATNLDLRLEIRSEQDELGELARTFNEMLDRLEHSFEAQKHFVSTISHELRTPLAAMIVEWELALHKNNKPSEYQQVIRKALEDAQKLVRLSNSLLDLAKASYDYSRISFKPLRIDELLLDTCQEIQKIHENYYVYIHFETEFDHDEQISVWANEYLLKVAFLNLIENGCKFSENHQSKVLIDFAPQQIILKFTDQGMGISQEDLPHIFKPFFRGKNQSFAYGNGIGLSLTEKIIILHKGTIQAYSMPLVQTVFTVVLPTL